MTGPAPFGEKKIPSRQTMNQEVEILRNLET